MTQQCLVSKTFIKCTFAEMNKLRVESKIATMCYVNIDGWIETNVYFLSPMCYKFIQSNECRDAPRMLIRTTRICQ